MVSGHLRVDPFFEPTFDRVELQSSRASIESSFHRVELHRVELPSSRASIESSFHRVELPSSPADDRNQTGYSDLKSLGRASHQPQVFRNPKGIIHLMIFKPTDPLTNLESHRRELPATCPHQTDPQAHSPSSFLPFQESKSLACLAAGRFPHAVHSMSNDHQSSPRQSHRQRGWQTSSATEHQAFAIGAVFCIVAGVKPCSSESRQRHGAWDLQGRSEDARTRLATPEMDCRDRRGCMHQQKTWSRVVPLERAYGRMVDQNSLGLT